MKKTSNPLLAGLIAGGLACLAKNTVTGIMVRNGIQAYDAVDKAAGIIIRPYRRRTAKTRAVGWLADAMMGTTVSTIFAALHRKRIVQANAGTGILTGLFCWTALYGGMGELSSLKKTTPNEALMGAGWHVIFGAMMGSLIPVILEQEEPKEVRLQEEQMTRHLSLGELVGELESSPKHPAEDDISGTMMTRQHNSVL